MEYRLLGCSGLNVSVFSFGVMTFGGGSGQFGNIGDTRGSEAQRQIDQCIDAGVDLEALDTGHTRKVIAAVEAIAQERGVSLSQVALNWVARKPGVSTILIGARTTEQLTDNLAAADWSLTDAEMAQLDAASARPPIYPYDMHRSFNGERNPPPPLQPGLPSETGNP